MVTTRKVGKPLIDRAVKQLAPKGQFGRNVLTVMGGIGVAQAIAVLISPVLTRLYSPADFGVLALYVSLVAIGAVVATLRYELAILLPKNDREACDLAVAAVYAALVSCSLGVFVILVSLAVVDDFAAMSGLGFWLYVIPLSVFLTALYQSLGYWVNRKSRYTTHATSRILQTGSMSAAQVLTGVASGKSGGLITGHLLGQALATGFLLRTTLREDREVIAQTTLAGVLIAARRHGTFRSSWCQDTSRMSFRARCRSCCSRFSLVQ